MPLDTQGTSFSWIILRFNATLHMLVDVAAQHHYKQLTWRQLNIEKLPLLWEVEITRHGISC